jgi:hypothetical protein
MGSFEERSGRVAQVPILREITEHRKLSWVFSEKAAEVILLAGIRKYRFSKHVKDLTKGDTPYCL